MNRKYFRTGLGQTTHIEEGHSVKKITEVGQDMILIIGIVTDII